MNGCGGCLLAGGVTAVRLNAFLFDTLLLYEIMLEENRREHLAEDGFVDFWRRSSLN